MRSKSITLELPEKEAVSLELVLDEALEVFWRLDEKAPKREKEITQLKTETHELMRKIKERLHVAEAL